MLLQKQINISIGIDICIQNVFCIPEDMLTKHLPGFYSKHHKLGDVQDMR